MAGHSEMVNATNAEHKTLQKNRIISSASDGNIPATFLRERIGQSNCKPIRREQSDSEKVLTFNQIVSKNSICGLLGQMHKKVYSFMDFSNECLEVKSSFCSAVFPEQVTSVKAAGANEERFEFIDKLELHDFETPALFDQDQMHFGHSFISVNLKAPTWCDKCGDFIWGVYKRCFICENCHYTCHNKCRTSVTLECAFLIHRKNEEPENVMETSFTVDNLNNKSDDSLDDSRTMERLKSTLLLTNEELKSKIEYFNNNTHGLLMNIDITKDQNSFQGFIRVHLNLIRPINMRITISSPSIYDILSNEAEKKAKHNDSQITSFYLPKDTTKVIHISSTTTTKDVICLLLSKFSITDNPRKFAMYERKEMSGKQATTRRIGDKETPLTICLNWTDNGIRNLDVNKFILQENDSGEIMWDGFSMPELESFLGILNHEEYEYINQVKAKYCLLKVQLTKHLQDKQQRTTR